MALLDDLQRIQTRLVKIKSAQAEVAEARRLGELRAELEDANKRIALVAGSIALLRANKIRVTGVSVESALSRLDGVAEKFKVTPASTTLKSGTRWTQLTASLGAALQHMTERRNVSWKEFVTTLFSGSPPDKLETQLAKSQENVKALEHYRREYLKFAALRQAPPSAQEPLDQLIAYSKALGEIRFKHDHVSDEVKCFIDAAATTSGFRLEDLTQSVLEALREHDLLSGYIVRQRAQ